MPIVKFWVMELPPLLKKTARVYSSKMEGNRFSSQCETDVIRLVLIIAYKFINMILNLLY